MTPKSKSFWIANFILAFIFISAVVFAWNNPPGGPPPTGSGAIAVDASYNVGVGTAAPTGKLTVRRSSAGTAFSVRDTADAADVFTIKDTGQIGAGMVPGAATRLGISATGYNWPLFVSDGTRQGGINFSIADAISIGASSVHRINILSGNDAKISVSSSGRVGINVNPDGGGAPGSAFLSVGRDIAVPLFPPSASTVLALDSSDGTAGGSSIRALGSVYAGGVILTQRSFNSVLADLAEYVRVEGGAGFYEQGDIIEISSNPDMFRKSRSAYGKKLAGVVSTTGGVILGENEIEKDAGGKTIRHAQLALAGRVPVKVTIENGPIAIGDAITSSSVPGIGMKATRNGRVVGFALESYSGSDIGYVKILVNPHYWIAE